MLPGRRRLTVCGLLLILATLNPGENMAAIHGVLRKNTAPGANSRYFTDDTGKAIYLTGTHTWPNLVDGWLIGHGDPAPAFDWNGYLSHLVAQNHNFIRLWAQELPKTDFTVPCGGTAAVSRIYYPTPNPWLRTGPGTAADGKPKFDLTQLNPAYFDRLQQRVTEAQNNGIYVGIMLFEGFSTRVKTGSLGWSYSPFHANNNVNGINGDPNGNGCGIEAHSLQIPAITAIQKAYVNKVVDTVNGFDNVLYEISNEEWNNASSGYPSIAWQTELMNHIRTYEAGKPKQHPVIISCIYNDAQNGGENGLLTASTADAIAPYGAGTLNSNPPVTSGGTNDKVIIADTDHIWGIGGGSDWVWKCFTRGYNPIYMDGWVNNGWIGTGWYDTATYNREAANAAMGATLAYARRMNLGAMPPQNALASTAYCLANAGAEYLVYQPGAGAFNVNGLAAGTYTFEWTRPDSGAFHSAGEQALAAGSQSFTPPFTPAVLFLKIVATNQVGTPVITPAGGEFYGTATVQLTCATDGATIRYTLDGTEPTTNAARYSVAIALNASATLKAKAFKDTLSDSNTMGANFVKQSSSGTLIDDDFDDGDTATNSGGTGSGWNRGSFNGAPLPTESGGAFNASMGTENGIGAIHGKDTLTFWDEHGMTATWVIRDIDVATPHEYNGYLAYCWELGIISANASKSGSTWNMSQVNRKGGFYISVGKLNDSDNVEMWVVVSNKRYSGVEGTSGFIRLPLQVGSVLGRRWTAPFPLTVTATLSSTGWVATATGLATPIAGNWTTSLINGTNDAGISDEFANGAFLFAAGRNHGIDGSGNPFTPNSGALERVTAIRNAGNTVATPIFTPDGNVYLDATDVLITCPTSEALIRYTLDGTVPSTNSGTLYTGAVHIAVSATLKAIAYKDGMTPSTVTSASYVLLNGPASPTLLNGDFENDTTGWAIASHDAFGPACAVITNQGFTAGPYALALGNANAAGNAVLLQAVQTLSGTTYSLTFDYGGYGLAGRTQELLVELLSGGVVFTSGVFTAVGPGNYLPANTTFATRSLDFVAPSNAVLLRLSDQTTATNTLQCDGMIDNVTLASTSGVPATIRLSCIGDSITAGAYPGILQTLLGATYLVQNDGVGGMTMLKNDPYSYWTGGRLPQVAAFTPNVVTIALGTNDSKVPDWSERRAEFFNDYFAMVDLLQAQPARPRVFAVLPPPAWSNAAGIHSNTVQLIIADIRQIAAARNLPVIDCNTPLLASSALFPDGVHPNAAGADAIARIFHEAITNDAATPVVDWPTCTPAPGTYTQAQDLLLTTSTTGAVIRFTTNGATPTTASGTVYTGTVHLAATATLRAIATKEGMTASPVIVGGFVIATNPTSATLVNGSFENGTNGWAVSAADGGTPHFGIGGGEGFTDGVNALILGNANGFDGNTEFTQVIGTAPGGIYAVRFDYGAFGNGNRTQTLRCEALDGTNVLTTVEVTAKESKSAGNFDPAKVVFTTHTNVFVAQSAATRLRFSDRTPLASANDCDGVLDNVRLDGPPADPTHAANGTPVSWLDGYGLDGDYNVQELDDPDRDGMFTWQEYVAGTDPTNANSCLKAGIDWQAGRSVVTFDGLLATGDSYPALDRYYAIQHSTNLAGADWQPVPGYTSILGEGRAVIYTNPVVLPLEYFRVGTWLDPQ